MDSEGQRDDKGTQIVIVGGGLTAGTLAKSLSERGHNVVLIARKALKTEQFDFPPVWLGPKALAEFARETDFQRRYETIQQNRGGREYHSRYYGGIAGDTEHWHLF